MVQVHANTSFLSDKVFTVPTQREYSIAISHLLHAAAACAVHCRGDEVPRMVVEHRSEKRTLNQQCAQRGHLL